MPEVNGMTHGLYIMDDPRLICSGKLFSPEILWTVSEYDTLALKQTKE
jgi:hypothetical protein